MEQDKMQAVGDFNIKQQKRKKIATIVIFLIIFGIFAFWGGLQLNKWWQARKELIDMGFASNKFPFRLYTERELVEMGRWAVESQELINTPTRIRPEQTYTKFRQALIDGDIDKAAECFTKEKREEWEKSLYDIKEKGFLKEMIGDLPEKIQIPTEENLNETALTSYDYESEKDGKWYSHILSFEKNWDGDWLIEDL
jgi:hypothetical protein